jgi:Predicted membrane protein (DUF2207)
VSSEGGSLCRAVGGTEAPLRRAPRSGTMRGVSDLLGVHSSLSSAQVAAIAVGAALTAAWLALALVVRIVRQPRRPDPGPPTLEVGPEPPAVANLLVNGWRVTRDAVPATLLDLAARGALDVEQVAPGEFQVRMRRGPAADLTPYERRVLELLAARQSGGVVPAGALTAGPEEAAKRWWRAFRKEVVADAQARGLSEDLWNARSKAVVGVAAALPAVPFGIPDPRGALAYAGAAIVVLGGIWGGGRQRHTPAGLEAASRWLGVEDHLRTDSVFDSLPPTAVATWERLLAYGAALGTAAGAVRPIPMGAEDDHRAWSSFGGRWRQVRVRYPRGIASPGWGSWPWKVVLLSLLRGAIAAGLVWLGRVLRSGGVGQEARVEDALRTAAGVLDVVAAVLVAYSLLQLVRGVADLFLVRQRSGVVVRARERGDDRSRRWYLGIDDGSTDRIRAFRVGPGLYQQAPEGSHVTLTVTRILGFVSAVAPAGAPSPADTRPPG